MEKVLDEKNSYYRRLFTLAMPIVVQHIISVSLNLVDNIMVGKLGALPLAAVGTANQVYSIYDMFLFGLFSGASVPLAQYFGAKDYKKIKQIVGMDIFIGLTLGTATLIFVLFFAPQLIGLFTKEQEVIEMGAVYLRFTGFTYLMMGVSFAISYNSRSVQIVKIPTYIHIACILVNTGLNYILIYGKFGAPAMGVRGAAIATLIARTVEMLALVLYLYLDKSHPFHGKISEYMGFGRELFGRVMKTAMPVVISEGGWSLGVTLTFAAYGKISAEALAVMQVSNVLCTLCQCASFGVGNASAALTGETLGQKYGVGLRGIEKVFESSVVFDRGDDGSYFASATSHCGNLRF